MGSSKSERPFKVNPSASRGRKVGDCAAELNSFCACFEVRQSTLAKAVALQVPEIGSSVANASVR